MKLAESKLRQIIREEANKLSEGRQNADARSEGAAKAVMKLEDNGIFPEKVSGIRGDAWEINGVYIQQEDYSVEVKMRDERADFYSQKFLEFFLLNFLK